MYVYIKLKLFKKKTNKKHINHIKININIIIYIGKLKKRQSMEERNKIAKIQHEQELQEQQIEFENITKNLNDQYKDWLALKDYKNSEKDRRRDSIAKRNEYYFTHIKCKISFLLYFLLL